MAYQNRPTSAAPPLNSSHCCFLIAGRAGMPRQRPPTRARPTPGAGSLRADMRSSYSEPHPYKPRPSLSTASTPKTASGLGIAVRHPPDRGDDRGGACDRLPVPMRRRHQLPSSRRNRPHSSPSGPHALQPVGARPIEPSPRRLSPQLRHALTGTPPATSRPEPPTCDRRPARRPSADPINDDSLLARGLGAVRAPARRRCQRRARRDVEHVNDRGVSESEFPFPHSPGSAATSNGPDVKEYAEYRANRQYGGIPEIAAAC